MVRLGAPPGRPAPPLPGPRGLLPDPAGPLEFVPEFHLGWFWDAFGRPRVLN